MTLPDFLIVGAMKCGTSTLAAQLAAQPGFFMAQPKEPNFFSNDEVFARGLDWYARLFDAADCADLKGEASTHYTKLPTYPNTLRRMQEVLPAPRLIYIVRDPIERAISHYIHEWTEGRMPDDPVAAFERHPELIEYGRYAMQITPFVEAYGKDVILLSSLERLKSNSNKELRRISIHLGFSQNLIWNPNIAPQNVSVNRYRKLPLHGFIVESSLAIAMRRILVPKSIRRWIRESRQYGERPELPTSLVTRLRGVFAMDLIKLRSLFPDVELGFEDRFVTAKGS